MNTPYSTGVGAESIPRILRRKDSPPTNPAGVKYPCKPGSVSLKKAAVIRLEAALLPSSIAIRPDGFQAGSQRGKFRRRLFDLAPGGVYPARPLPRAPVSSYLTISPLPDGRPPGGIVSVALSLRSPPPGIARRPALRSPDFPLMPMDISDNPGYFSRQRNFIRSHYTRQSSYRMGETERLQGRDAESRKRFKSSLVSESHVRPESAAVV